MDMIEKALSICLQIYQRAENVKTNKERCQRVTQRVKALQELVLTIKQRGPGQISAIVGNALSELCNTLTEALHFMDKYSQSKAVVNFLKSGSHEETFCNLNERLTDNFQVLSGALQVEQGDMLYRVYETVAGRRQDEEYCSELPPTNATVPMLLPNTMPPVQVSSPTASMPVPSTMPPMQVSSPTVPMPVPSTMPPMQVSSPTVPMPVHYTMPPMQVSRPTFPTPVHYTMPPMQVSRPTASMPVHYTMPPMQVSSPTASMPVHYTMRPMQVSNPTTTMPLRRPLAPIGFSPTVAPSLVHRIIAPARAPFAPMTYSTQNAPVVRNYMVNNSYFP